MQVIWCAHDNNTIVYGLPVYKTLSSRPVIWRAVTVRVYITRLYKSSYVLMHNFHVCETNLHFSSEHDISSIGNILLLLCTFDALWVRIKASRRVLIEKNDICAVFQLQTWNNRPRRVQRQWFWWRPTTGKSNMAAQTGSTYISESMIYIVEIPTANRGFQPQQDRRKCFQDIASTTENRK